MTNRTDGGIYTVLNIWAENGDKNDPTFTETDGWGITYSQAGGNPVERKLMNRNFNKASACLYDVNRFGANLIWSSSPSLTYEIGAIVTGSDGVNYRSKTLNTSIDPVSDSGTNWTKVIPTISGDGLNINVNTDARNNVTVSLTSNLSDKANKSLNNVTVGDFLGKFDNSQNIAWTTSGSKAKASYVQPVLDANRKDLIVTAADNGSEIFANADNVNVNITLPLYSTLPDNWYVKLYIFDTGYETYPANPFSVNLVMQGTDNLQRASGRYSSLYKIRSPNSVVYIRKKPNDLSFFLEGVLRNSWAANCSYINVDHPTEKGLTDVILIESADDRNAVLNFNIFAGIVGNSTWSNSGVHYAKYFEIDFAPLNNLINKFTTANIVREFSVQPIMQNTNLGQGRQFTAITSMLSQVRIIGGAGTYTNRIQVSLQSPIDARTNDAILFAVRLKFQNWFKR